MTTQVVALPAEGLADVLRDMLIRQPAERGQHLYPVVDGERRLKGVITRGDIREFTGPPQLRTPVVAHPDEPLRAVVLRTAETGFTRLPVVDDGQLVGQLVGMVSLHDLPMARVRSLHEERTRERVLRLRLPFGRVNQTTSRQSQ